MAGHRWATRTRSDRTDEEPPFDFDGRESAVRNVLGERKFTVRVLDEDGALVRRYTRRTAMIPAR